MEFIISSAELLKGAQEVFKAIPAKTSLPILENFLFVLNDGKLEITASDQELTLRTLVKPDSVASDGKMAVPARQLIELLKALPDQPISIKVVSDNSFECIWNNGNSSLPFFPANDYPQIKGVDESTVISASFPSDVLFNAIGNTVYATADDEMRPTMNGVFFDLNTDSATLVASDSHKLICYSTKECKADEKSSFILHKKPAGVIKSLLDHREEPVTIKFDGKIVEFHIAESFMICRLIIGKFPDYGRVIPQNNSNILKIDRSQLLNTIRRVAVCANKASNYIKLDLRDGQLEVTAQDLGFALSAYEKLVCDYAGDELSIGFKSSFLIDVLANMSASSLVIKFADARRAALIVPAEEEEESDKLCAIVMPITVS